MVYRGFGLCFDQCEETVDGIVAFMFDDPERLADLEAIRSGERSPGLWNTCNFCALNESVQIFWHSI